MTYQVDKQRAAEAQIDTAIELFLKDRCAISTVVLGHGAWNIIKDVSKDKQIETSREWMYKLQNATEKEFYRHFNRYYNFLSMQILIETRSSILTKPI
jgi:hypothetical protein